MVTNATAKRDPAAARRRILEAAAKAFAVDGPMGARIDAIAADARVNKRMLYHYFGDKQALFVAVLHDRLGGGQPFGSFPTVISQGLAMTVLDLRLMVWAAVGEVEPAAEYQDCWRQLVSELAAGQDAGQLRADIDAPMLAVLVFAVSALPELLPGYVGLSSADQLSSWSQRLGPLLRKLMVVPAAAPERLHVRPRVRMLPQVLDS